MAAMSAMPFEPGAVTSADLYRELVTIRIATQDLALRFADMSARAESIAARSADQEMRLRVLERKVPDSLPRRLSVLERWQWRAAGALTVAAVAAGMLSGWLGTVLAGGH